MASKRCDVCRKDKVQLYTCQVCRTGAYCGSQCQIAKMSEGLHKMCLIGNNVPPPPPRDAGRFALIRWLSDPRVRRLPGHPGDEPAPGQSDEEYEEAVEAFVAEQRTRKRDRADEFEEMREEEERRQAELNRRRVLDLENEVQELETVQKLSRVYWCRVTEDRGNFRDRKKTARILLRREHLERIYMCYDSDKTLADKCEELAGQTRQPTIYYNFGTEQYEVADLRTAEGRERAKVFEADEDMVKIQ